MNTQLTKAEADQNTAKTHRLIVRKNELKKLIACHQRRILVIDRRLTFMRGQPYQTDVGDKQVNAQYDEMKARALKAEAALAQINDIRNSIIGLQSINWSEHIYPLVAALDGAGIEGMGYDAARKFYGTMLERTNKAEAALIEAKNLIQAMEIERGQMARSMERLGRQRGAHVAKFKVALALAQSMILSGEEMSPTSKAMFDLAFKEDDK